MPPAPAQPVPVPRQRFRFIQIDPSPYATPEQVESLVEPAYKRAEAARAGTQIVLKAGPLDDLDHPGHSSYFIGICYPAGSHPEEKIGERIFDELREECHQIRVEMKLPVVEILESHSKYRRLVKDFGF